MRKSIQLIVLLCLTASFGWSQTSERNMVTEGLISGMEASIGDMTVDQEDQFVLAYNQYVKSSQLGNTSSKQKALVDYQAEVKRILTPQKYALLNQDPKMKKLPAFRNSASTN